MAVKYIDQMDIDNETVLIRVDYNVPYDEKMKITDDTRIKATIPTLNYCIEKNCKIILVAHLGRPKGKVVPEMSLKPVAEKLSELINRDIKFVDAEPGDKAKKITDSLLPGEIALLENIRFFPGETKNDKELGRKLASMASIYLNDAFGTTHRAHSSNAAITEYMDRCGAGFLLKKEIEYFNKAMNNPEKPFGAIIGGAKVSSKLDALNNILTKVDYIIIGGGMAFTFLKAKGYGVGKSLLEEDLVISAKDILNNAEKKNVDILLPVDIIAVEEFNNKSPSTVVPVNKIPENLMGLDIGPESLEIFSEKVKKSKTVIWNGPMGVFEMENFAKGTFKLAEVIADTECLSIVGGGDSVTAINNAGLAHKISYISTGGGAFLDLLEGKTLPAIAALDK